MHRLRRFPLLLTALFAAFALSLLAASGASAAERSAWRSAENLRQGLFDAQTELILGSPTQARKDADAARQAYSGRLRTEIRRVSPELDRTIRSGTQDAVAAVQRGDERGLATARGAVRGAIFAATFKLALAATVEGDADTAREWLMLRDFRTATRFTRPEANATRAIEALAAGKVTTARAEQIVTKDLLDAYQARLRELLIAADGASERGFRAAQAESLAQARAYWRILTPRYVEDRGDAAARALSATFAEATSATRSSGKSEYESARTAIDAALDGFTAAPFTAEESARRAQQLLRFLALIPVEYDRGVNDTRVTLDFEIQEAIAFRTGASAAFADLQDQLAKRDRSKTQLVKADLEKLGAIVDSAGRNPKKVVRAEDVTKLEARAEKMLTSLMPKEWVKPSDESDYDLIALTLDRMETAVAAGQYQQAEQARLEAYAFFEFGPERRLRSFDPGLALDVEGVIWFGARDHDGLAEQLANRAPRREIRETRLLLDELLADSAATLGDSANKATVVTNSAIIVFREGLEAVLILAAITASFVGVRRRMRRPVLIGAAAGLVVSAFTWVLAQTVLRSLEQYGEKLEAVVGLVAIAVLLLIMNWFFHKVYWSQWIGRFHRQRKKLEASEKTGFFSAQVLGLMLLGLTSVYREGFETVLFLQSLQLSAGTATVLEGAGLGLALTMAVAVVTFALQRKLPYKKMLVVTGVLIGLVLVVMVGQTARTMQGTGWVPISPIDADLPYWLGLWFGVFPTWETLGAQIAAALFVVGSYYLAQEVKVKRPQRRHRRRQETEGLGDSVLLDEEELDLVAIDVSQDEEDERRRDERESDALTPV